MTNVPPLQFTAAGAVAPAEADILAGAQADFNDAFGGNLDPSLSTPQGQLATTISALVAQANAEFVNIVSQMDPAYAQGRMQDAVGRIYFLTRNPALPTLVACTIVGLAGTVIPVNSQAVDTAGNVYLSTEAATIPIGGSVSVTFANAVAGAIACPSGTLTKIYRAVPGWDSITNPADGVLGQAVESRYAFETRRQQSVAINSQGMLAAVLGAVLGTSGIVDAYATENNTASSVVVTGVTVLANSIFICVYGGDNTEIAEAIRRKKMPGCNMTGATTVVVQDTNPLFVTPYPTYIIKFQIATPLSIYYAVSLSNNLGVPADAATLIRNAIISAFAGDDGGPRARIGSTIFASRFYANVASLGSWAQIISIFIGTAPAPTGTSVLVPIDEIPAIAAGNIEVTIV